MTVRFFCESAATDNYFTNQITNCCHGLLNMKWKLHWKCDCVSRVGGEVEWFFRMFPDWLFSYRKEMFWKQLQFHFHVICSCLSLLNLKLIMNPTDWLVIFTSLGYRSVVWGDASDFIMSVTLYYWNWHCVLEITSPILFPWH